jgi:hypothetical protein
MHQAESSRWQWGSQIIPELWVHGMELASYYPSGTWNLDLAPELLENFWLPGTDCVCLDMQLILFTVNAMRTSMLLVHLLFYSVVYWALSMSSTLTVVLYFI